MRASAYNDVQPLEVARHASKMMMSNIVASVKVVGAEVGEAVGAAVVGAVVGAGVVGASVGEPVVGASVVGDVVGAGVVGDAVGAAVVGASVVGEAANARPLSQRRLEGIALPPTRGAPPDAGGATACGGVGDVRARGTRRAPVVGEDVVGELVGALVGQAVSSAVPEVSAPGLVAGTSPHKPALSCNVLQPARPAHGPTVTPLSLAGPTATTTQACHHTHSHRHASAQPSHRAARAAATESRSPPPTYHITAALVPPQTPRHAHTLTRDLSHLRASQVGFSGGARTMMSMPSSAPALWGGCPSARCREDACATIRHRPAQARVAQLLNYNPLSCPIGGGA